MDKPLIRQELPFEPTFFTRVFPMILLKSDSDSLPILTICLLDSLWASSETSFNYAWKNMDLACMDSALEGSTSAHVCSSAAQPTPNCLRGLACPPYLHSQFVRFPFSTSVSILLYAVGGSYYQNIIPYTTAGQLNCSFPLYSKGTAIFCQRFCLHLWHQI